MRLEGRLAIAVDQAERSQRDLRVALKEIEALSFKLGLDYISVEARAAYTDTVQPLLKLKSIRRQVIAYFSVKIERRAGVR